MINVHIYPSPFKFETRILKETESIINQKLAEQIIILCIRSSGQPSMEYLDQRRIVKRFPVFLDSVLQGSKVSKILAYFEFYVRTIVFCLSNRIHIVNCHSLMVLPIGALIKWIKGTALIYDPHELETERINLRGLSQKISKFAERHLIQSADKIIVVGKSIQQWYKKTYKLENVFLLRNVPVYTDCANTNSILKQKFGISNDEIVFIYQGLLMKGRGVERCLNVFKQLDVRHHIVFMGFGPMESEVKVAATEYNNIHYHPAVKSQEIISYTAGCDIGIFVPDNICLSYYYSLPNKFFEYIVAGLPVIVSNFPDMSEVVEEYDIGWKVPVNEKALLDCIKNLEPDRIAEKRRNVRKCKLSFTWQSEESILLEVYKDLKPKIAQQ